MWMFGYFFSKSLIRTRRTSLPPGLIGLADQVIVPDVALPGADDVPPAGKAVLLLVLPVPALLLLPLLLQPARAIAPAAPTTAVSCQPLRERLSGHLRDPMCPPLNVVTS